MHKREDKRACTHTKRCYSFIHSPSSQLRKKRMWGETVHSKWQRSLSCPLLCHTLKVRTATCTYTPTAKGPVILYVCMKKNQEVGFYLIFSWWWAMFFHTHTHFILQHISTQELEIQILHTPTQSTETSNIYPTCTHTFRINPPQCYRPRMLPTTCVTISWHESLTNKQTHEHTHGKSQRK